jgi:ABC-2 type transport system ATP-binding protein
MRILSGFMPATSGVARVAGHDVFSESLQVRRNIGYMPENVPLYPDMRVDEFLRFRGALKGVSARRLTARVGEVKDLCGLADMGRRIIGTLSKGYRQRVGLADALVHDPKLLILDEPTIGLDPNQIRQVRELIKALGKRHTVLISTHILPEVEMTCTRVLILNKGRIEASDTPENLTARFKSGGVVRLEVRAPEADVAAAARAVEGVDEVRTSVEDGWTVAEVYPKRGEDLREALAGLAVERRWALREVSRARATLEDVFVRLTQKDTL